MKWFLLVLALLSCVNAYGYDPEELPERYYINDNGVLLYKIIDWWYYSLSEESDRFCGSTLTYQIRDNAGIEYNEAEMILKLKIQKGFTDMISIFKGCGNCFGPSYLKCTSLNRNYFGNGVAMNVSKEFQAESTLMIKNVDREHARRILISESDIVFEVEGVIGGLLDGKIALHQAGTFRRNCPEAFDGRGNNFPVTLKVLNSRTKEPLLRYTVISEN